MGWLCQVPNVINQAETYDQLTRHEDAIGETLDIEVQDHPLAAAFCALQNTQSKKRACDFDLNVDYVPSDEENLDNNKHDPYFVIVPLPMMSRGQSGVNCSYAINDLPKAWDPSNGAKLYTFKGHNAPVCPHSKNNTYYVFSTSSDGQIKAWWYENNGPNIDFDTPYLTHNALVYSMGGTRLFSCGYDVSGESFIVEWDDDEGAIKRRYIGLDRKPDEAVHFDTVKNQFLVAGDDSTVKYWDIDNVNMLASLILNSLPACPCVSSSKNGKLVAVSTTDNKVLILANNDGLRLFNYLRGQSASRAQVTGQLGRPSSVGGSSMSANVQPQTRPWAPTEVQNQSQLRALMISNATSPTVKLLYKSSGDTIIALAYNGELRVWKWQTTERNATGMFTTAVPPELWRSPSSRIVMTNDISQTNLEQAVPCLEINRTDSYLMSASGGKISLFNTSTFKTLSTTLSTSSYLSRSHAPRQQHSSCGDARCVDNDMQCALQEGYKKVEWSQEPSHRARIFECSRPSCLIRS